MKHAMKEYPLYAVTDTTGHPVFPGDQVKGMGGYGYLVAVTRGPEVTDGSQVAVTDVPNGTRLWYCRPRALALEVSAHCPQCGLPLQGSEDDVSTFIAAHSVDSPLCDWTHPDWS